ncbi:MAG: helix-turn-helix domain-containing protein [Moorea sp. SIO4A3]|nr:helix-turn-helix domain-containing protein [Moorena sp. SIO4A3]
MGKSRIAAWGITLGAVAILSVVFTETAKKEKRLGQWAPALALITGILGHVVGSNCDREDDQQVMAEEIRGLAEQSAVLEHYFSCEVQDEPGNETAKLIINKLAELGASFSFVDLIEGLAFDRYTLAPKPGQKLAAIDTLEADIQYIVTSPAPPLVSKSERGIQIDIPRRDRKFIDYLTPPKPGGKLDVLVGYTLEGNAYTVDLGNPSSCHLLGGGCTGGGKSELAKTIVMSLVDWYTSDQVQLAFIDTKRVDFAFADYLGNRLWQPVAKDPSRGVELLESVVTVMDERYAIIATAGLNNIDQYNERVPTFMYRIVVVHDEINDITCSGNRELKNRGNAAIAEICRKGRAAGIHYMAFVQKTTSDSLPTLIKSNIPVRVSLKTTTWQDGHNILGQKLSTHNLLGKGDCCCYDPTQGAITRLQIPYASKRTDSFMVNADFPEPTLVYLTPQEAQRLYSVTPRTLARWADAGKIDFYRTKGGHRRYESRSLERACSK